MAIRCLLLGHRWKFAYNHGIPLGSDMSFEKIEALFKAGEIYEVEECRTCKRQSRTVKGRRVLLPSRDAETP